MCQKSGRVHNDINISLDKAIKSLLARTPIKKCKMCCLLSLIKNSEKCTFFFQAHRINILVPVNSLVSS